MSTDAAIIVDPAQFIGGAPNQDSVFFGLVNGNGGYIGAWYNNHFYTSGIDGPNGTCCAAVTVQPGDRLALQIHGTTLSSWVQHDGVWRRLLATDVGSGVTASDLASYHVMFGLRGDPGTLVVSRFEVRTSRP